MANFFQIFADLQTFLNM